MPVNPLVHFSALLQVGRVHLAQRAFFGDVLQNSVTFEQDEFAIDKYWDTSVRVDLQIHNRTGCCVVCLQKPFDGTTRLREDEYIV